MTTLVITRGYPASGKSTWARAWAEAAPGRVRVNRDDLRHMMFGVRGSTRLGREDEQRVTAAEHAQVEALLRTGVSVVVDATHLRSRYLRAWADMAVTCRVGFEVQDFPIDADTCVARDAARSAAGERAVGEQVIREMAARFPIRRWPRVESAQRTTSVDPGTPYLPDPALPPAYLVDIDGTLADMGSRHPYSWHRVGDDRPVEPVVRVVRAMSREAKIIVMSGRDEICRDLTEHWLTRHGVPWDALYMRPRGDSRKDAVVKAELFDKHIRNDVCVLGVFDDRLQVCRMWHRLGLPLFRIGDPDADF